MFDPDSVAILGTSLLLSDERLFNASSTPLQSLFKASSTPHPTFLLSWKGLPTTKGGRGQSPHHNHNHNTLQRNPTTTQHQQHQHPYTSSPSFFPAYNMGLFSFWTSDDGKMVAQSAQRVNLTINIAQSLGGCTYNQLRTLMTDHHSLRDMKAYLEIAHRIKLDTEDIQTVTDVFCRIIMVGYH